MEECPGHPAVESTLPCTWGSHRSTTSAQRPRGTFTSYRQIHTQPQELKSKRKRVRFGRSDGLSSRTGRDCAAVAQPFQQNGAHTTLSDHHPSVTWMVLDNPWGGGS